MLLSSYGIRLLATCLILLTFLSIMPVYGLENTESLIRENSVNLSSPPLPQMGVAADFPTASSLYDGKIQVVLELTEARPEYLEALEAEGITIQTTHGELVQALADYQQILSLQKQSFVKSIDSPQRPVHTVISEGVNVIQSNLAAQNGLNGKGVKVAVIDTGFDTKNPEIAANIKEARSFRADRSIIGDDPRHGTAVAEIIADVAPQAELYLYSFDTLVEFLNVIDYAAARGVKVISTSIGWASVGPYDGTSRVSKAMDAVRQKGVLPVVAAGNEARRHWAGTFTDTDGDGWHEFSGQDETNDILLNAGDQVSISLSWNDWPTSCQDYNLFLYEASSLSQPVASATRRQSCTRTPVEEIDFTASIRSTYRIAISNFSATKPVKFELYVYNVNQIQYFVESGSILNLADAMGALTVGATNWRNDVLESYSSRGPTADGRVKPDVVAPTCVSTSTYGSRGFCGTSASAPHVAGAATILFGANPSLSADDVATLLENGSVDLGVGGKDNLYGAGRIRVSFASFNATGKVSGMVIDNTTYESSKIPMIFVWPPGTTHSFKIIHANLSTADTRYIFSQWTDNGNPLSETQTTTLTYNGGPRLIVAEYTTQYLLTVSSSYGSTTGGGWHNAGSQAPLSVTSPQDHGNQTRHVFTSWTGDLASLEVNTTIVMDSPKKATANWKTQYRLSVISAYGRVNGDGWYDSGVRAEFSAPSMVDQGNRTRRVFLSWRGDSASNSTASSITVSSPKRVVADWKKQYLLEVESLYGSPQGAGWKDSGTVAAFSVATIVDHGNKTRRAFTGWTGDSSSTEPTGQILMNLPKHVKSGWKTQFFLSVDPSGGEVSGEGWYDNGSSAVVSAKSPSKTVEEKSRLVFTGWAGDATSGSASLTVGMSQPRSLAASWKTQFFLKINSGAGDVDAQSQWLDRGASITVAAMSPSKQVENRSREVFTGWSGSATRSDEAVVLTMNESKTLNSNWKTQFYLRVVSPLGGPEGEGWYDGGSTAVASVYSPMGFIVQDRFSRWTGDAVSTSTAVSVLMDSPKTLVAEWVVDYTQLIALVAGAGGLAAFAVLRARRRGIVSG
ncbi:MAG: S8 family serine peptidase [Thaumarchaeota archaeon]|nr:S8 family serine peptidase [Nitrososphaerota archaeon]